MASQLRIKLITKRNLQRYFKEVCLSQLEPELSVKFFSKLCFVIKIFSCLSDATMSVSLI